MIKIYGLCLKKLKQLIKISLNLYELSKKIPRFHSSLTYFSILKKCTSLKTNDLV